MSRHISLLPAGGATGWTQIATATPVGVSAVYFTDIPSNYSDLLIQLKDVSHNSGTSTAVQISVSSDGVNYSGTSNISSTAANTAVFCGAIYIPMYRAVTGVIYSGVGNIPYSPSQAISGLTISWRVPDSIAAIRLLLLSGAFTNGTITLYGR